LPDAGVPQDQLLHAAFSLAHKEPFELPRMRDRTGPACLYTGKRRSGFRFALVTIVFQFLVLFGDHHGYRFIPHRVVRIFIHHL
jgi:hypothetical protein